MLARLLLMSIMLVATGCTTVNVLQPGKDVFIDVRMVETRIAPDPAKDNKIVHGAYLKIFEFSDDFPGVVNEIHLPGGDVLVEYFDTPDGVFQIGQRDHHSVIDLHGVSKRYIYTYPAETEGMDLTDLGFGELPQNRDGSVVTNTDPLTFNAGHNEKYKRQGKVIRDMRDKGRWWSIRIDEPNGSIIIELDDKP